MAAQNGVVLFRVRRIDARQMSACILWIYYARVMRICRTVGWDLRVLYTGWLIRVFRFITRRSMIPVSFLAFLSIVWLSSNMVLKIHVAGAQENIAEVRRFLTEKGIHTGMRKNAYPLETVREEMALFLPGLAFAGIHYEGSVMTVECVPSVEKEIAGISGTSDDIVALEPGIITRIAAVSGTPVAEPGDVVAKGQILIRGEERISGGGFAPVHAQGKVEARVWARGNAGISLKNKRIVETGQTARSVAVRSPWHERILSSAPSFSSQQVSVEKQMVIDLYLPLWREVSIASETVAVDEEVKIEDAASQAQAAAERLAREQCPHGAEILNKTVIYKQTDSYMQAEVILEFEKQISGRVCD